MSYLNGWALLTAACLLQGLLPTLSMAEEEAAEARIKPTSDTIYRWKDEQGVWHFSQQKPSGVVSDSVVYVHENKPESAPASEPGPSKEAPVKQASAPPQKEPTQKRRKLIMPTNARDNEIPYVPLSIEMEPPPSRLRDDPLYPYPYPGFAPYPYHYPPPNRPWPQPPMQRGRPCTTKPAVNTQGSLASSSQVMPGLKGKATIGSSAGRQMLTDCD